MLMPARRRPIPPPTIQSVVIPAPIGGLNTINPGADMPPTDAILLFNMVAAEYGLRTRLGYREWCAGLTGSTNNEVRSVLPFTGSSKTGSASRLFAATNTGIWDVTASSQAPSQALAFATPDVTYAGYGNCCVFVNYNGNHFLLYCDEANGYHVYTETTGAWQAVPQAASNPWLQATTYALNDLVSNAGASYRCTQAGTSDATALGPAGGGTGIVDGTCTWDYYPSIGGADPTKFCQVNVWASRVWFVERDTGHAWYTGIGSLFGTVTKLVFGSRFKAGGDLRGLFNWTTDGGSGLTTSLVAISGGGDVVIYQGTDPAQAATFQLKGVWSLGGGGIPLGRRIATDFGGDLLLLSSIGVMQLSQLISGVSISDQTQYATKKIGNLFAKYAQAGRGLYGWQVRLHPSDNTLLINAPQVDGSTQQFAMSLLTKGWSIYRDMPTSFCAEAFDGGFYLGTTDGRVLLNVDYQDGVTLADPNTSIPIQWEVLTAFQTLGSPRRKRVHMIRPHFLATGGGIGFAAAARFDYDFSELGIVASAGAGANAWDSATWDTAKFGDEYTPNQQARGGSGCGSAVAIILRGSATSKTMLVGIDVAFDVGGLR